MSFRARITALFLGASIPVRPASRERVVSTVTDGWISPDHERRLIESGRRAVDDILTRTHVERSGHFEVPRVGA